LLPSDIAPPDGGSETEIEGQSETEAEFEQNSKVTNQTIQDCQAVLTAAEIDIEFATVVSLQGTGQRVCEHALRGSSMLWTD